MSTGHKEVIIVGEPPISRRLIELEQQMREGNASLRRLEVKLEVESRLIQKIIVDLRRSEETNRQIMVAYRELVQVIQSAQETNGKEEETK